MEKILELKLVKNKKAFSLAEVLLTLVIIGIVATMTLPIISQGIGRQEILAKVNKANSVLKQSVMRIAYNEGLPVGDFSFIDDEGDMEFFEKFIQVVDTIRICRGSTVGCFSNSDIKQLNGTNAGSFGFASSLITKDGFAYAFEGVSSCANKGLDIDDMADCKGSFIVDINGYNKPNRYGYDIFFFALVDGQGIVPAGKGNGSLDCRRSNAGITCAAKVIDDQGVNYR